VTVLETSRPTDKAVKSYNSHASHLLKTAAIKITSHSVFVIGTQCVSCEVGTEFLNIIYIIFSVQIENIIEYWLLGCSGY
jgi:hypothetical protein